MVETAAGDSPRDVRGESGRSLGALEYPEDVTTSNSLAEGGQNRRMITW